MGLWSLPLAHSDPSKAPVSSCHPSKYPQDRVQLLSTADNALCSGTSYLALLACPAPYSGSCNCLCLDALFFLCPCALVHAVLLPGAPLFLAWFKTQCRGHFLQTFLGLSWAALPLGVYVTILQLSESTPACMVWDSNDDIVFTL